MQFVGQIQGLYADLYKNAQLKHERKNVINE